MQEMGMFNGGGMDGGFQVPQGHGNGNGNRGGRGGHQQRGRGGRSNQAPRLQSTGEQGAASTSNTPQDQQPAPEGTLPPTPSVQAPQAVTTPPAFVVPERPQSPTLCKFGLKCTNAHCRWSHPSPVATTESGVVLSNDPCEQGKDCKDKDCIKAHVSPAVANPTLAVDHAKSHNSQPPAPPLQVSTSSGGVLCRYGMNCTRRDCTFQHPPSHPLFKSAAAGSQPCRFGSACTRASCPYQHPEGRVLPTSFHRGVGASAPLVNIQTPTPGSMGSSATSSPHKSVVFNRPASTAGIEAKIRALQEEKNRAERAVKDAQAAATGKKDNQSTDSEGKSAVLAAA